MGTFAIVQRIVDSNAPGNELLRSSTRLHKPTRQSGHRHAIYVRMHCVVLILCTAIAYSAVNGDAMPAPSLI